MHKQRPTLLAIAVLALGACAKDGGLQGALAGAERDTARVLVDMVSKALDTYYVKHRQVPDALDGLVSEGYVKRDRLVDPWGRPLRYEVIDPRHYWLCSDGPDQTARSGDDLCNPETKPTAVAVTKATAAAAPLGTALPTGAAAPLGTALPTGAAGAAEPLAGWIAFSGPGDTYKARFPGTPTTEDTKLPSQAGEQLMRSAMYATPNGDHAYVAAVIDIQLPAGQPYDVKAGLEGGAEGMVSTMGATLDSSRDTTFEGLAGKEIVFHGSAQGQSFKGLARLYIQDNPPRLWQVGAISVGGEVDAVARAYVDAFKPIESHAKTAP